MKFKQEETMDPRLIPMVVEAGYSHDPSGRPGDAREGIRNPPRTGHAVRDV